MSFISWPSGMRGEKALTKNKPESVENGSGGKIKPYLSVILSLLELNQTQADRKTPADPDLDAPWIRNKTFAPFAFSLRGWWVHDTALYVTAAHPARTSAVNVPALSRFTHSSSPLNESANHPMQPTSQTMLYVSGRKIMLGYFRWRGGTRLNWYILFWIPLFHLTPGCEGLTAVFLAFVLPDIDNVTSDRQPHLQSFKTVPVLPMTGLSECRFTTVLAPVSPKSGDCRYCRRTMGESDLRCSVLLSSLRLPSAVTPFLLLCSWTLN